MIQYTFTLDNGTVHQFDVDLDRSSSLERLKTPSPPPSWTDLSYHQCTNCPLSTNEFVKCPTALDLEEILGKFRSVISYQKVRVEVKTQERTTYKDCDVQTGLRSLMGLVMATSACPILRRLKGLANYHLPFATMDETLFRTVSVYLLKQYYEYQRTGMADLQLSGLDEHYQQLSIVNRCFTYRIRAASDLDANVNALGTYIYIAEEVSSSLQDQLKELKEKILPG
jgi:hypothetical protein